MDDLNEIAKLSGVEMAELNLRRLADAYQRRLITFEPGRLAKDVHVHLDTPAGVQRFTYAMFSPMERRKIVAASVIILSSDPGQPLSFQINWAVMPKFRQKGFGMKVAEKALAEFTTGMKAHIRFPYGIQAVVDDGNEASLKIARKVVGGEEVLSKEGKPVHNFLKIIG